MADVAKRLAGPILVPVAAATVYTVPVATTTVVRSIHVTSDVKAEVAFTLSIGVDALATRFFDKTPLGSANARGVLDWSGFLVLNAADVLQITSDTLNALVVTISGVEVT